MNRWSRLAARIVAATLYALSAAAAAQEAPARNRVAVEGLKARAEVLIDHWGVPHIYAHSAYDAFFVQGWNAARDRLWQIDLWRRSGLGELAEVLGEKYVAYRDLFPLWLSGQYFPLLYTRSAIEKATERKIVLEPAKDQSNASAGHRVQ